MVVPRVQNLVRNVLSLTRDKLCAMVIDEGDDPPMGELHQYLLSLGTPSIVHSRKRSLAEHLAGTGEILHRWNSPPYLVRAGLFHSIYSTDTFSVRVLSTGSRRELRARIGTKAEYLVYLFGSIDRGAFFASLNAAREAGSGVSTLRVASRHEGDPPLTLTTSDAVDLLILYVANMGDQSGTDRGPGLWISQASRLVEFLRFLGGTIPFSLWEHSSIPVLADSERRLLVAYTQSLGEGNVCDVGPLAMSIIPGEVHVWNGFQLASQGHSDAARVEAERGLAQLSLFGTSWDKRLTLSEWQFIGSTITQHDDRVSQAIMHHALIHDPVVLHEVLHHRIHAPTQLLDSLDNSSDPDDNLPPRMNASDCYRPLQYIRDANRDLNVRGSGMYGSLRRKPVWDTRDVPIAAALEASFELIKGEISRLDASLYQREAERIRRKGSWDVVMLYERGRKNRVNCFLCPTVTRIIERYDTMRTITGLIYVSRMRPGTRIERHRGATNLRLRLHLGISIPPEGCGLQVGNERISWENGKCILFDDFFEHEAWNDSDKDRVVLIVDLWHPDISHGELAALKEIQHYAYRQSLSLAQYWAANDQAAMERRIGYD